MPLDDRLRDSLRRSAATIEPDVERHLEQIRRRSGRRTAPARSLAALAASIAALAVLVQLAGIAPMGGPAATPMPTASASAMEQSLAGSYRVDLDGADPAVDALGMGGAWILTLGADSSVEVVPPAAFAAVHGGTIGRSVYAVEGDRLHATVLARELGAACAGSGTYRWERTSAGLRFTLDADTCDARATLFTSAPWIAATD